MNISRGSVIKGVLSYEFLEHALNFRPEDPQAIYRHGVDYLVIGSVQFGISRTDNRVLFGDGFQSFVDDSLVIPQFSIGAVRLNAEMEALGDGVISYDDSRWIGTRDARSGWIRVTPDIEPGQRSGIASYVLIATGTGLAIDESGAVKELWFHPSTYS